jgi:transposase-like protein
MRRSKSIETLLPILYLKGISTGDFSEALAALLGNDAAGLSASAIGRLKDGWFDEHAAWQKRDLSAKRYVFIWADGIHLEARLKTREQRCWVHKTANVLAKLPKSQQPKAKRALQEIRIAETKAAAELAFDAFIESYALKYDEAADCLSKDRDTLLAFYDFPAEHWKHLRTTNPIESTFATVRHRTIRSKGCLSNIAPALHQVGYAIAGISRQPAATACSPSPIRCSSGSASMTIRPSGRGRICSWPC